MRDLDQLVRSRFANEHGDLVVAGLASVFLHEGADGSVALAAPLAELRRAVHVRRPRSQSRNPALRIPLVLNLIAELPHLARKGVAIDLCEVCAAFVDAGSLQRLPSSFRAVPRYVRSHRVRMKLRVEFAAGVVMVDRQSEVPGDSVRVRTALSHSRCGQRFQLPQSFGDRSFVRLARAVRRRRANAMIEIDFGAEIVKSYKERP